MAHIDLKISQADLPFDFRFGLAKQFIDGLTVQLAYGHKIISDVGIDIDTEFSTDRDLTEIVDKMLDIPAAALQAVIEIDENYGPNCAGDITQSKIDDLNKAADPLREALSILDSRINDLSK